VSAFVRRALLAAALAALSVIVGCGGDDVIKGGSAPPAAPAGAAPASPGSARAAPPSPTANMPPLPKRTFGERDFAESETNRDPFHSYAADLIQQMKRPFVNQRRVLVEHYSLEELKLEGIVIGSPSSALLVDPTGFGWIAKVGDLVGKPEVLRSGGPGGGVEVPINWRVDRIRPSDVVFVREDPKNDIPPTTRVIPLRPTEESVLAKGQGVTVAGRP